MRLPHAGDFGDIAYPGLAARRLRGLGLTHAVIDMLLPLAAAAFGLTAIGIVFLICASTTS
jgi:hypothetical protein